MAEEKSSGDEWGPLEILIGVVIGFLILVTIFQRLFGAIDMSKPGSFLSDVKVFAHNAELAFGFNKISGDTSKPLALNSPFHTAHASVLFDAPGGNVIGSTGEGSTGTIIGGPVEYGGNTWWKVRFADGTEGWMPADSLVSDDTGGASSDVPQTATGPLGTFFYTFRFISTAVSLLLLIGIMYAAFRIFQIRRDQMKKLMSESAAVSPFGEKTSAPLRGAPASLPGAREVRESDPPGKSKWIVVEKHISSESENDWRLAILEADILLDELARSRGWQGDNLGERLRGIDKSDFQNLDKAWEAHKVRNTIAHEGVNFVLSSREARRVIALYKDAFDEFNYI